MTQWNPTRRTVLRGSGLLLAGAGTAPLMSSVSAIALVGTAVAPTPPVASSARFSDGATIGSDVCRLSAGRATDVTYSLEDPSGTFEISATRLRLLARRRRGETFPITITARNAVGSATASMVVTCVPHVARGLVEVFDATTGLAVDPEGRVATWTGATSGWVLGQSEPRLRPRLVSAGAGGHRAVRFDGIAQCLEATSSGLIGLLDAARPSLTILAALVPSRPKPGGGGVLTSWSIGPFPRDELRIGPDGRWSGIASDTGGIDRLSPQPAFPAEPKTGAAVVGLVRNGKMRRSRTIAGGSGSTWLPIERDQSVRVRSMSVGARVGTAGSSLEMDLHELRIYDRALDLADLEAETRAMSRRWGIEYAEPAYIDLAGHVRTFSDDFDSEQIFEPSQANDHLRMSRPWVPHYAAFTNRYGSSGAISNEAGWMVDPRDPRMAPYDPFSVADGILSISTRPRPRELADLPLDNWGKAPTTWLGGALISLGVQRTGGFAQQYGYFEARLKSPQARAGNFPAWWLLSATGRWPTEVDVYEMFGAGHEATIQPGVHSDPYWPAFSGADSSMGAAAGGGAIAVDDLTEDFHLLGVDIHPDTGIRFYFDRRLVATLPPAAGMIGLTIVTGGSGVLADDGRPNGTIAIKAASPRGDRAMAGLLTVQNGVVTEAKILNPGSGMIGAEAASVVRRTGTALPPNVVVAPVIATDDPPLPPQYNTPFYLLLNFALGSFTGMPSAPATFQVDYVRVWRRRLTAPTLLRGPLDEVARITAQMGKNGAEPTPRARKAIDDFVRAAKSWRLRHDTQPMSGQTVDWDTARTTLWSALDGLFLFRAAGAAQGLVNWVAPEIVPTAIGGIAIEPRLGLRLPGTIGSFLDTRIVPTQSSGLRQLDAHLGVWLTTAAGGTAVAPVMGCAEGVRLDVGAAGHDYRIWGDRADGGSLPKLPPETGHLVATRGWRFQYQSFLDGSLFHAGYGQAVPQRLSTMKIGSHSPSVAGATTTLAAAHWGRRLMPDEVERLHLLLAAYFQAID